MEKLPTELLLIICDKLDSINFFRFHITCKWMYRKTKQKEAINKEKLLSEYPKYAAKYIVVSGDTNLLKCKSSITSLLIDKLYFYSISLNKLEILEWLVKAKYPAPHDILYTAVYYCHFDIADWLYFRKAGITETEIVWLIKRENERIKEWLKEKKFYPLSKN